MNAHEASRTFVAVAERSTTLYSLTEDYLRILDLLEDSDAEHDALEQHLDSLAGQITHKAEAIAGLIKQCEGMAATRKAEADRMRELAAADQRHADRLRDYVLRHMQALGTERIDTARFRLSLRTNPPAVQVLEELLVPDDYKRVVTTVSVDKRAILEVLKTTGEIVPGVEVTRGQRLEIR
jgi:CRP-like cAMP-binding protein